MIVTMSMLDKPNVNLAHVWKSTKEQFVNPKLIILLCRNMRVEQNTRLRGMIQKSSPPISATIKDGVWKLGTSIEQWTRWTATMAAYCRKPIYT